MKKKIICISIITGILLLVYIFGRGLYYYGMYSVPNEKYFGDQYKEMLHIMSFRDKKQANEIMEKVDGAFSFVGESEVADSTFGKLSRFCISREGAVTEKHDLKLVTADFTKNDGYLWFVYDQEALDENNQIIMASGGVLVRTSLEKTDKGWMIIATKEHP